MHIPGWPTGQHVNRDRPVDRRVSVGRSRLILHWFDNYKISGLHRRSQPKNLEGAKMFDFRRKTAFCLEKRLSKHKMTIFLKILWGAWLLWPPLATPMYKVPEKNIYQSIFQKAKNKEKRCILWHFVLVALLPTGQSRVIKKFSGRPQSKTSWPPLAYTNQTCFIEFSSLLIF